VYVTDYELGRVQKFTGNGTFIAKSGDGQFNGPAGVVVDTNSNVYVADRFNDRVVKLSCP
jgi:DNA-binding beta-propeller fold protein YncE